MVEFWGSIWHLLPQYWIMAKTQLTTCNKSCNIGYQKIRFIYTLSAPPVLNPSMTAIFWDLFVSKDFHKMLELSWVGKCFIFLPGFYVPHTWAHFLKMFYLLIVFLVAIVDTHFHLHDLCIPSASFSLSEFCYIITVRDYNNIVVVL